MKNKALDNSKKLKKQAPKTPEIRKIKPETSSKLIEKIKLETSSKLIEKIKLETSSKLIEKN